MPTIFPVWTNVWYINTETNTVPQIITINHMVCTSKKQIAWFWVPPISLLSQRLILSISKDPVVGDFQGFYLLFLLGYLLFFVQCLGMPLFKSSISTWNRTKILSHLIPVLVLRHSSSATSLIPLDFAFQTVLSIDDVVLNIHWISSIALVQSCAPYRNTHNGSEWNLRPLMNRNYFLYLQTFRELSHYENIDLPDVKTNVRIQSKQ